MIGGLGGEGGGGEGERPEGHETSTRAEEAKIEPKKQRFQKNAFSTQALKMLPESRFLLSNLQFSGLAAGTHFQAQKHMNWTTVTRFSYTNCLKEVRDAQFTYELEDPHAI